MNFQAMLLQPNKKNMKKLREVLYELYKHLDSSAAAIIDVGYVSVLRGLNTRNDLIFESSFFPFQQSTMDIPGLNLSQQEYYPYVYYKIDCNLLDFK